MIYLLMKEEIMQLMKMEIGMLEPMILELMEKDQMIMNTQAPILVKVTEFRIKASLTLEELILTSLIKSV